MRILHPDKVRMTFEMAAEVKTQVEELTKRMRAGTYTEMLRRVLTLYDLISTHVLKEGGKVVLRHKNGTEETLRIL